MRIIQYLKSDALRRQEDISLLQLKQQQQNMGYFYL